MMLRSKVPGGTKVRQCAQIFAGPFRATVRRRCILAVGFGREGYKNFDGYITYLQMKTYLIIRKLGPRKNKRGQSYGMAVSYYQKPEELWGYEYVTSTYKEIRRFPQSASSQR